MPFLKPNNPSRLKKSGALMAAAVALVGTWEGLRTVAYPDRLANNIPTVCYGWTIGVKLGDRYTVEECKALLGQGLVEFEKGIRKCLKSPDAIPDKVYVSFLSFAYNVGTGAFCKSTLLRKANAGDLRGACNELPRWNRAGGRVVKGLVNRRADEKKLCLEGLA
jgi:lysozyme